MQQGLAPQVCVDEGSFCSQAEQCKPQAHELSLVGIVNGDHIALLDSMLLLQPCGKL